PVAAGNTISWSLQPHKKSLNFAIFKHPGGSVGLPPHPTTPASQRLEPFATTDSTAPPPTPSKKDIKDAKEAAKKAAKEAKESKLRNDGSTVVAKLEALGMKSVFWAGKCEADKVSVGTF